MSTTQHGATGRQQRSGGVFASTITIARISGIEIGLNWSWLAIFALIVWSLAGVQFPAALPGRSPLLYATLGVVASVVFFASLILHELGHALQAKREGVRIEGITLWLFGGVAKLSSDFPSAGAEFRIAVAGPAVTLLLAIAFSATALLLPSGAAYELLIWLGFINAMLLVFNLVPAMPLDGGRVLVAALWARSGDRTAATHRATRIGGALAGAMIVIGVLDAITGMPSGIWLALVGWFILEAGRAEDRYVTMHAALDGLAVADLMTAAPVTVSAGDSMDEVMEQLHNTPRHTAYPIVRDGLVEGMLDLRSLAHRPAAEWRHADVTDLGQPAVMLTPETPAGDALELLSRSDTTGAVLAHGRLVGVVSLRDVARALALGRAV